jgi:hypothetical protein
MKYFWWVERIRIRDLDLQLESSAFIRGVRWSADFPAELKEAIANHLYLDGAFLQLKRKKRRFQNGITELKRLHQKEDNHLLIFCIFSRGRSSNISQKDKLGNF